MVGWVGYVFGGEVGNSGGQSPLINLMWRPIQPPFPSFYCCGRTITNNNICKSPLIRFRPLAWWIEGLDGSNVFWEALGKCIDHTEYRMHRLRWMDGRDILIGALSSPMGRNVFKEYWFSVIRIFWEHIENILRIIVLPVFYIEYWFSTIRILRTHFNEDILKTFKTHWEYFSSQGRKCILRILVQCDKTELPPVCFSISFEGSVSTIQ